MDEVATMTYSPAIYDGCLPASFCDTLNSIPSLSSNSISMPYFSTCYPIQSPNLDFSSHNSSWISSASDETDDQQSMIDERKQRRMISNRESARRSRMRKQKLLDELWSQVLHLRSENRELIDRLNSLSDQHEQVMRENHCLKKHASELQQKLGDFHFSTDDILEEHDDVVPCKTTDLRDKITSQQPISPSITLLH